MDCFGLFSVDGDGGGDSKPECAIDVIGISGGNFKIGKELVLFSFVILNSLFLVEMYNKMKNVRVS